MSSGQKEVWMDAEEEAFARHVEAVKKKDPEELAELITKIRTEWLYLNHYRLTLTGDQHSRLQTIHELLRLLP